MRSVRIRFSLSQFQRELWDAVVDFMTVVKMYAAEHGLEEHFRREEPPVEWTRWPLAIAGGLLWVWRPIVCAMRGHELETHSDITPDHGIECTECHRCGHAWERIYY